MGLFDRLRRPSEMRASAGGEPPEGGGPPEPPLEPSPEPPPEPPRGTGERVAGEPNDKRGLSGWVEERARRVVREAYQTHAEDLEERALRVAKSIYERSADDLEQRAVRAMRSAIEAEAERIKRAIEHAVAVKKREVRLSLLVLVVSSLVYLALYWFTSRPAGP